MDIVPIKVDIKTLYENRYLYTDDSHYNSLVISNLINQSINLIDMQSYDDLDLEHKIKIYESNTLSLNYILDKDGLYILEGYNVDSMMHMIPLKDCIIAWKDCFRLWKDCDIDEPQYFYILTIVNEEL